MNIELKHLAPYLTYELNCQITDDHSIIHRVILMGLSDEGAEITDKEFGHVSHTLDLKDVTLILKPLSDLTKGELRDAGFDTHIDYLTHENKGVEWTLDAPYNMVAHLFENHFDVFGLIDKGLAVDINTLI